MKVLLSLIAGLLLILLFSSFISLWSYHNLTIEKPVATIIIHKIKKDTYKMDYSVDGGPFVENDDMIFNGDEWSVEAHVFKIKYYINALFGVGPKYDLERLSSRFSDIKKAKTTPPSVFDLSQNRGVISKYFFGVFVYDTNYGSGTYAPMGDGAEYQIFISPTGLLIRPGNSLAQQLLEDWK